MRRVLIVLAVLALGACKEDKLASVPPPASMTPEQLGHYCQMNLAEHPGPKAQVHLAGMEQPLFFSQVRDAIAYQRMPEQSHAIRVIYVSDMARAPSWDDPGRDNWIEAGKAVYVVGARIGGGMGAPELVPFGGREAAEAFTRRHGGRVLDLTAIPDDEVLAPVAVEAGADNPPPPPAGIHH